MPLIRSFLQFFFQKFHYYMLVFAYDKKTQFLPKLCANFGFFNTCTFFLRNTNATISIFFLGTFYFYFILVFTSIDFFFNGLNNKYSNSFLLRKLLVCKNDTIHILILAYCEKAQIFVQNFLIKGDTNLTNSLFLRKVQYFDLLLVFMSFSLFRKLHIYNT